MTSHYDDTLRTRRHAAVQRHIDAENTSDLDAMIASFHRPRYEVFPMGAVFEGEQPVRDLVAGLVGAFPDFHFAPTRIHHADDAVIVEARMTGTHRVEWAGIPPQGRRLDLPLVCIFDFEDDRLVNEKVVFDLATVQRQLGS
ncbi:MAG: ester cyclase [Panacagrimonas sp.]